MAGAAACGGGSEHAVMAVSVPAQKAIAERFGGGVEVLALVSGDVDPESFEISIRTAAQASGAKAYFPTGALPFERNFVEALHGSVPVVATGTDIEPIEGTHGEHGGVDPHVWTSAGFRRAFADGYFRELCRLYPDSVDKLQPQSLRDTEHVRHAGRQHPSGTWGQGICIRHNAPVAELFRPRLGLAPDCLQSGEQGTGCDGCPPAGRQYARRRCEGYFL